MFPIILRIQEMKKSFSLRKLIDLDEPQSVQDSFANGVGVS